MEICSDNSFPELSASDVDSTLKDEFEPYLSNHVIHLLRQKLKESRKREAKLNARLKTSLKHSQYLFRELQNRSKVMNVVFINLSDRPVLIKFGKVNEAITH